MREKGTGRVFRRGASWYLRVRIQGRDLVRRIVDPETGERAETLAHARRLASRMLGDLRPESRTRQALHQVRLEDLNREYERAYPGSLRPRNWRMRERVMRGFCERFVWVADISHATLGEWVSWRLTLPHAQRSGAVTPATINRELAFLRRVLRWAEQVGRIERDPARGFRALREAHHRERVLSDEEVGRLLRALEEERFAPIRLIVMIGLFCGMRQGEIFGLRWEAVDESLRVFDLLNTKTPRMAPRRRRVPIPAVVWEELQQRPRESEWIFPSPKTGGRLDNIRKSWASLLQAAGIEGFHFHDLRHTAATWLGQACDLKTLMEILGHTSPRTAVRYINPALEQQRAALDEVAGRWRKK